jgi:hypothetical protein
MKYHQMTIRLDGDLAGEFASRFEIGEVSLGNRGGFVAAIDARWMSVAEPSRCTSSAR